MLPEGTFVIAIYGLEAEGVRATGSIITKKSTISQACMAFTQKGVITNEFLYSWYKKHGNVIGIKYAQGTKQQNLSYDIIERLTIHHPSLEEQEKLNSFIELLDTRISTQIKVIEDLEILRIFARDVFFDKNTPNCRLGDIIAQVSERNKGNKIKNILSVSNKNGFINQSEQFEDRIIASDDTKNYKVVSFNEFAYNPARINVGSIARLSTCEKGIVSPMYICFRTGCGVNPEYLEEYLDTRFFFNEMEKRLEGSVRQCLSFDSLCSIPFFLPTYEEQTEASIRLKSLNDKISIEKRFLDTLYKQKRYFLEHLFI